MKRRSEPQRAQHHTSFSEYPHKVEADLYEKLKASGFTCRSAGVSKLTFKKGKLDGYAISYDFKVDGPSLSEDTQNLAKQLARFMEEYRCYGDLNLHASSQEDYTLTARFTFKYNRRRDPCAGGGRRMNRLS